MKPPIRKLSGNWLDQATGLSNAKLESVHLLLPEHRDSGPTLERFSYKDTHECELVMANHIGFSHIAFEVEDVESTFSEAIKNGADKLGETTEKIIAGVEMPFVFAHLPPTSL